MRHTSLSNLMLATALASLPASTLAAQGPGGPAGPPSPGAVTQALEQQPDTAALRQLLGRLTPAFKGDDAIKSQATQLTREADSADASGDHAAARERYLHAITLLRGMPWTDQTRFGLSLAITPAHLVADDAVPLAVSLAQTFPATYTPAAKLSVHLLLARQPAPGAPVEIPGGPAGPGGPPAAGAATARPPRAPQLDFKEIAHADLTSASLTAKLAVVSAPVSGDSGDFFLAAEIFDGDTRIARIVTAISIVPHLAALHADVEKRLARVKGSEVTRGIIAYPFDLARMIDTGQRPRIRYDYVKGIDRSEQLLTALEAKSDPIFRTKGRTEQAYNFTAAGEISPFGVYVPTTWDGHSPMKVLLILHGVNEDQNSMLDRDGGIIPAAAEKHGYLVVTPNGYRTDAWYGATARPGAPGNPGNPVGDFSAADLKYRGFSEQDVLNVLATVIKEYPVDLTHVYLMGQSMGGAGAWHLAQKYPDKWAGLVATAAAGIEQPYPYERLRGMPIICGVGTLDALLPWTRDQAAALNKLGIPADYHEVVGANHHTIVAEMLPDIFTFIDTHQKTPAPPK